ncbi:MAG: phosphoribosylformylglycinamidine cyclo-ligase, partial [Candidatus Sungbacteria bacterium]|nr:phosphoribosylformylglycinamidine cyclo-ligase [Candidatus Sungbacteria bacterium]
DHTITVRFPRSHVIDASRISAPAIIVGFSSTGRATWETMPNSGIGSNGFTNARHDTFTSAYKHYHETFDSATDPKLVYCGRYTLFDSLPGDPRFTVGTALLSPTRTYLPLITRFVREIGTRHIPGIIHCSGGGQAKAVKFGSPGIVYVKDDLFPIPPVFQMLHVPGMSLREMYATYNMGHRLEVVVKDQIVADACLEIAAECGIEAQVIGRVVPYEENPYGRKVVIKTAGEEFSYGV